MVRPLLVRGMLVGLCAGVVGFVFAFIFGEPQLQHAIDFGDYLQRLNHEPPDPQLVSRGVQRSIGLLTSLAIMGVALGGIFSMVFAWAYGRIGALSPRLTSAVLALSAYLTITVVPFTKYPANPPTIGNPDTIDRRTLLYFTMVYASILAFIAAVRIRRQLLRRLGNWNAAIVATLAFVAVIAVAELILPSVHETPPGFPADVLWRFRLASLGISATIWTTMGLMYGIAAERLLKRDSAAKATTEMPSRSGSHEPVVKEASSGSPAERR
jgi:lysylphosphatidylglycerol synthetase-like protein (DUF2156 family)